MELIKIAALAVLALARKLSFTTQAPQPTEPEVQRLNEQALRSL